MAKTLGSVSEGSIVYLNESGVAVPFYVACHNYESALNGAGRTLLVRQCADRERRWHSSGTNVYSGSEIDNWVNTTWLSSLDEFVRAAAASTTIYVSAGDSNNTITTISRAAFLLSMKELNASFYAIAVVGTALPTASTLKIAYNSSGTAKTQWTRSGGTSSMGSSLAGYVSSKGAGNSSSATVSYMARPALTLPAEMGIDDSNNVTEPTVEILHGAMIDNVLCVTKKCYAMIDGVLCAVPYGLANVDGVMTKIQFEEPEPPAPPVQTYTVTIERNAGELVESSVFYFKINGKTYTGSSAVTLTVNAGTAWEAYVNKNYVVDGYISYGGQTFTGVKTGTVTSNLNVRFDATMYNNMPYAYIYITKK